MTTETETMLDRYQALYLADQARVRRETAERQAAAEADETRARQAREDEWRAMLGRYLPREVIAGWRAEWLPSAGIGILYVPIADPPLPLGVWEWTHPDTSYLCLRAGRNSEVAIPPLGTVSREEVETRLACLLVPGLRQRQADQEVERQQRAAREADELARLAMPRLARQLFERLKAELKAELADLAWPEGKDMRGWRLEYAREAGPGGEVRCGTAWTEHRYPTAGGAYRLLRDDGVESWLHPLAPALGLGHGSLYAGGVVATLCTWRSLGEVPVELRQRVELGQDLWIGPKAWEPVDVYEEIPGVSIRALLGIDTRAVECRRRETIEYAVDSPEVLAAAKEAEAEGEHG